MFVNFNENYITVFWEFFLPATMFLLTDHLNILSRQSQKYIIVICKFATSPDLIPPNLLPLNSAVLNLWTTRSGAWYTTRTGVQDQSQGRPKLRGRIVDKCRQSRCWPVREW